MPGLASQTSAAPCAPLLIDAGALDAVDHQDLAFATGLLDQPLRPAAAHLDLILVHRHAEIERRIGRIGVNRGIERDDHDAVGASLLHRLHQRRRGIGENDDRLGAIRDHVLDGRLLRRVVAVGGVDLELADEGGDVRRLGVGLGHLDHLGAPDIADVGVGERDVVRRVGQLLVLHRLRAGKRLVAGFRHRIRWRPGWPPAPRPATRSGRPH